MNVAKSIYDKWDSKNRHVTLYALTQTVCKATLFGSKISAWWVGQGCYSCSNAQQVSQCLINKRICISSLHCNPEHTQAFKASGR